MELSPLAARHFGDILEQRTGQQLSGGRRWRLETALQPVMRAHGCSNLEMLALRAGRQGDPTAIPLRTEIVEALLNHETSFFRDRAMFDGLRHRLLPHLAQLRASTRRLRIWSAGCATGQEPHSLAMLFASEAQPWRQWTIELVGTDVSNAAIRRARDGLYRQIEVQRGLAIGELLEHFTPEGEDWRLRPEVAGRTRFAVRSVFDPPLPGRFDLILCRNVLLYFREERRREALARLAESLAPDGLLLLGAGETVLGVTDAFRPDPVFRGCYTHRPAQFSGASPISGAMPNAA